MLLDPSRRSDASAKPADLKADPLSRGGDAEANSAWIIDSSRDTAGQGPLWPAMAIDGSSHQILVWSTGEHGNSALHVDALRMALQAHPTLRPIRVLTDQSGTSSDER